jgi:Lipoprotein confined to pathogenic Mycobacterium
MTETGQARRSRWKIVGWTIGVIAVIAVIAAVIVVVQLSAAVAPQQEPTVTPSNTPALEDQLRPKGSAEDALTRYESALRATADDLAKLVPGLTWQWNRDPKFLDCSGALAETRGVRVVTRNLVSNRPIPDDTWPAALEVVRDHAAELGAMQQHVYADKPGHHDIAFYADNGVELQLITSGQAVLSATSDCHLQRADL